MQVLTWGRQPPVWGKGWSYRGRRWVPRVAGYDFLGAPHRNYRSISHRFRSQSMLTAYAYAYAYADGLCLHLQHTTTQAKLTLTARRL